MPCSRDIPADKPFGICIDSGAKAWWALIGVAFQLLTHK